MIILPSFSFFSAGQEIEDRTILRIAVQEDIASLNPLEGFSHHWTWLMTQWLYDTPVFVNPENDLIVPYIAIGSSNSSANTYGWDACDIGNFSFLPSSDLDNPVAVIYYDFTNVLWHDGVQMDIDDVLFSYHVAAQHPVWRGDVECLVDGGSFTQGNFSETNWLNIDIQWESSDRLRAALSFTLQESYEAFFHRTLAVLLLPEHLWGSSEFNQLYTETKIWCDGGYSPGMSIAWNYSRALAYEPEIPVGNGPFKWGSRSAGISLALDTWRGHFFREGYVHEENCLDSDGNLLARQPYIDGLKFIFITQTGDAILSMKCDEIDFIGWNIEPNHVQYLCNELGFALQQSPQTGFTYLGYNMDKPSFGYDIDGNDIGKPLREAIAHSTDKNRITQRLTLGFGIGGEGPISSISSWFNMSIKEKERSTLFRKTLEEETWTGVGYVLDKPNSRPGIGNYWSNPDGSPIGSGINGSIEFMLPSSIENPIAAQAGLMICTQLEDIGIRIIPTYYTYTDMFEKLNARDYDMCISVWGGGEPESTLYQLFHSDNIAGNNLFGYHNYSYDQIINWGRAARLEEERKKSVLDGQGIIVENLPCDVLYYRTNIEAYRLDNFNDWRVSPLGTIFNRNSLTNIRDPNPYHVYAQFVSPPSALVSNSTENFISVFVKDQDGNPLEGAKVTLNTTSGQLTEEEGFTNSAGKFTTTFTAPYANPNNPETLANGTQVIIQIKSATYYDGYWDYDQAPPRYTLITVYPEEVPFLSITMNADPDIIDPDYSEENGFGFTYVDVFVKDENGDAVEGAIVAVSISPAIPNIEPATAISNENGMARFRIIATDLPDNDSEAVEYLVTAYAVYSNYKPGDNSITIQIIDAAPIEVEISQANSWDYYFVLPATMIGIFILMVAMLLYVRRMK